MRDQLTSGVDASVEDLGEQRLRSRSRAVRAFRVWPLSQNLVDAERRGAGARPPVDRGDPFQPRSTTRASNRSATAWPTTPSPRSRMADFFVVSRLSTMAFRQAPVGVRRIGEMLGVQYVLSGSVQTARPRALLVAELADARDGRIVWSQRFQGDVADMFAMQGELARKVVQSLAPYVRSRLKRARITNFEQLDAYAITLRGVELMHRLSPEDFCRRAPLSRPRSRATRFRRARMRGWPSGM